jgi:PTH1 family peptidyl-tRNA hydrolase
MKAVIGLGNPDANYKNTRHNIGFMVLDRILGRKNLKLSDKFSGFFAKSEDTLFLLPLTNMNLSGRAVVELMNFYKLAPEDIIVVFDDASLPLGTLRFRQAGLTAGITA